MRILALEPYYGGSHRAFLDGWCAHSRHEWTLLDLPPYKWKWRMRHAAITLADRVADLVERGQRWDRLFCSDMLNLAEFIGMAPLPVQLLPSVVYFHENQLTYPVRHEQERDYQFAFTNLTTALAATRVWFNSAFHRDSFLNALPVFLKRMPDCQPIEAVERVRAKARIEPPGIGELPQRGPRPPGPPRILWAARWEHDKNPDAFFEALHKLRDRGIAFRVSVIGERFREVPPVFESARQDFADAIDRWGYQSSRAEYESALTEADVIVSTADHEFFGLSVIEAIAAGAYPLLPRRLAYPEILGAGRTPGTDAFLYDGDADELARRLAALAQRCTQGGLWSGVCRDSLRAVERFFWKHRGPALDRALEEVGCS
ncbi:MAG TPA: DUF3524 domain-containing protein [Phycisphaerae bacterium]|nr:DUF3524 domain-containing protein [Phycisphaerae bacterium]